jgi:high-affinity nickel-transport protein
MLVGVVHGTAGSAALTLLVLSTISTPANGLLYILVFGIGSMIGMLLVSVALAMPLRFAAAHYGSRFRPIQLGTGVLTCAFGLYITTTVWLALK